MRLPRIVLIATLLMATAAPAFADATLFVGTNTTPANRTAKGVSVGVSLLVVGFGGIVLGRSERRGRS